MQTLSPADRVSAARIRMLQRMPFYGLLAMRLNLKPDPSAADIWVDGVSLGYNPKWVADASFDSLMTAIAHGANHIALLHHLRRAGRDDAQWQRACDIPVNAALLSADFELPPGVRVEAGDDMKSAEECYDLLDDDDQDGSGSGQGEGSGDSGSDSGSDSGDESGDESGDDSDDGDDDGEGQGSGSGAVKDQPGKSGAGMDESEKEQAIADTLKDVAAAAQQAKSSGFGLPAALERQLHDVLYPQEDWRELLRDYMRSVSKSDYSWSRPNRRFIGSGLYLPVLHAESEMGTLVVAVDTSGSIDNRKLGLFVGALNELLEELNPERVVVIGCDSGIHTVQESSRDEYPIDIQFCGMGSTDLRPPFEYCDQHQIDPHCLVYFTDLGGPKPESDPGYPVLWLDQGGCPAEYRDWWMPTFGRTIYLRG